MNTAKNLLLWHGSGAQADDRQFAVGFLLIFRVPLCRAGDLVPRLLAGVSVQLLGADRNCAAGDLDLRGVRVGGEVVAPGGVLCCPIRGRDDQPPVGAFGEVGERGVVWGAALGADGGQDARMPITLSALPRIRFMFQVLTQAISFPPG